jgi:quercetin dioxygenase-like cupin family protein
VAGVFFAWTRAWHTCGYGAKPFMKETAVDRETFIRTLAQEGFPEPVLVTREPGHMDEHTHPFEAKALIVAGEITIRSNGEAQVYCVGDVFHLPANVPHVEDYGPQGVQYLAGRKG